MMFYIEEGAIQMIFDRYDNDLLFRRKFNSWDEILHERLSLMQGNLPETDQLIKQILLLQLLEEDGILCGGVTPAKNTTSGGWKL